MWPDLVMASAICRSRVVLPAPGVPVSIMTEDGTQPSPPRASSSHSMPIYLRLRRASRTKMSEMLVPCLTFLRPMLMFILDMCILCS